MKAKKTPELYYYPYGNSLILNIVFLILIISIIGCIGCSPGKPYKFLNKKIEFYLQKDNTLTANEIDSLILLCNQEKNKNCDSLKVIEYVKSFWKTETGKEPIILSRPQYTANPRINFFIDNTPSMIGYFRFYDQPYIRDILSKFISLIGNKYVNDTMSFNYVDSNKIKKVYSNQIPVKVPYDIDTTTFAGFSDMNNMIDRTLKETNSSDISIFVSDCIFGVDGNTRDYFDRIETFLFDSFSRKIETLRNLSVCILKIEGGYDGYYVAWDNSYYKFKGKRPFYIWIIGSHDVIEDFKNKINFQNILGYTNSLTIYPRSKSNNPGYSILRYTNSVGNFGLIEGAGISNPIKDLIDIEKEQSTNAFQFCIGVDLNNVECDSVYKLTAQRYFVGDAFQYNDFVINNINIIDDKFPESKNERVFINELGKKGINLTHVLTVSSNNLRTTNYNLEVILKREVPEWVIKSNTDDDRDSILIDGGKTLGFKYMIEGIYDAYNSKFQNQNYFFELPISLKRKSTGIGCN